MLFQQGVGLVQRLEAVVRVAQATQTSASKVQKYGSQRGPGCPPGGDPLTDLGHALLTLTLHGQRPPAKDSCPGPPIA